MHLRHKTRLPVGTIAREWATERPGEDALDVVGDLLQAFWMGHLSAIQPAEDQPYLTRCRALALLIPSRDQDQHPGIAICQAEEERASMVARRDDGTIDVDTRTGILLPADPDGWTPRIRNEAYQALTELGIEDYAHTFITLFRIMMVSKIAFLDFIRRRHLEPPLFWYHPQQPLLGISEEAIEVLRSAAPADARPKRGRKAKYDYEAIDTFLDRLRLDEGAAAFTDQTVLYNRVVEHFGASKVPKRSQFQKHLTRYCADHFST